MENIYILNHIQYSTAESEIMHAYIYIYIYISLIIRIIIHDLTYQIDQY